MYTLAIKVGLVLLLLTGIYYALAKFDLVPNPLKALERKELALEPTALILDNVNSIAQLFTATYYAEIPHTETKKTKKFFGLSETVHSVMIIGKGTCYAGTDLAKLSKEDIQIKDSSVCEISIPSAKIIDIVMNPSDFDIYSEEGDWSPDEIKIVKSKTKEELKQMAVKSDIIKKANERSIQLFTDFLKSMGYKKVEVKLKA